MDSGLTLTTPLILGDPPHPPQNFPEYQLVPQPQIMVTRRKNEWLEAEDSEDEDPGYDSELAESREKAIQSRRSKRRKVEYIDSDSEESEDEDVELDGKKQAKLDIAKEDEQHVDNLEASNTSPPADTNSSKPKKPKSSIARKLAKSLEKTSKTGVIYISRIPPFMKPHTLKHFLEPSAPSGIGRLFLTPETSETHKSRVRSGGNKKRNFSDGWVEFMSKREAKIAAETLNTRIIGGKKGGYYHDDVWNLKYLKGFKWRHLTEQIANENAERSARLRAEGQKERREVREYLQNVERAKMLDGMEKKNKRKKEYGIVDLDAASMSVPKKEHWSEKRQFRQVEVMSRAKRDLVASEQPDEVKRVLSKIF